MAPLGTDRLLWSAVLKAVLAQRGEGVAGGGAGNELHGGPAHEEVRNTLFCTRHEKFHILVVSKGVSNISDTPCNLPAKFLVSSLAWSIFHRLNGAP